MDISLSLEEVKWRDDTTSYNSTVRTFIETLVDPSSVTSNSSFDGFYLPRI